MSALEPFETAPAIAVAVSGGADSLALTLLAADWAASRGGTLSALTVDHRLRPGSAEEAAQVAQWLEARGIRHQTLSSTGDLPRTGVQQAARRLRYRLLCDWCRMHGVLHLLVAHHRQDQVETVLMRLLRDSGVHGLAGMRPLLELPSVRILRPLLGVPPERLRAVLVARGLPWLDDPSNRDRRFTRSRLRVALGATSGASAIGTDLLALSARAAAVSAQLDADIDRLLALACRVDAAGFANLDLQILAAAPDAPVEEALRRVLACVGGRQRPCGREPARRLWRELRAGTARVSATLGGCRVLGSDGDVLICREARDLPAPQAVGATMELIWDGRFRLRITAGLARHGSALILRPLGLTTLPKDESRYVLPAAAAATLPALFDGAEPIAVPHLGFGHFDPERHAITAFDAVFSPRWNLSGNGYFLA